MYIVMHTHLKIAFKCALHFSSLAMVRFCSGAKLFQTKIDTAMQRACLLLNIFPPV